MTQQQVTTLITPRRTRTTRSLAFLFGLRAIQWRPYLVHQEPVDNYLAHGNTAPIASCLITTHLVKFLSIYFQVFQNFTSLKY